MTTCSTTVEYAYDHMNRMTKRGSEYYIHDGYQIVLLLNASTVVQSRFLWGASQDELIAEEKGSILWTLCDHLGSVRDVVNNSGASLNHLEYNAFGKLINKSSTSNVPTFSYTGKLTDDATDLQWNINRWYDANVGRWISEDPLSFDAGDGNLVRYAANSPKKYIDYSGLYSITFKCSGWFTSKEITVAKSWCGNRSAQECCKAACKRHRMSCKNKNTHIPPDKEHDHSKIGTVTIKGKCTITILFGHGHNKIPHNVVFNETNYVAAGFVGCHPKVTNNQIDMKYRIPGIVMIDGTLVYGPVAPEGDEHRWFNKHFKDAKEQSEKLAKRWLESECCPKGVKIYTKKVGASFWEILPSEETFLII